MADLSVNAADTLPAKAVNGANREVQIAELAYQLWQQRGRPDGDPEQDWYEAERLLNGPSDGEPRPPAS